MDTTQYPENFWRGIPNKEFISNGFVLASAFQFDDTSRLDGMKELSINWNDCEQALITALNQRKPNGKLQFPAGVVNLELAKVEFFLSSFVSQGLFAYERSELPENPYHGNLLITESLDKQRRSLISSGLALVAGTNITYQPPENE